MSHTLPPPLFDPFAPGFTDDPYPQYAALRAGAPVYQHAFGFWLLTSYEAVSWLLRANLSVDDRNVAPSPFTELRDQMYGEEGTRTGGVSMLDRDPPQAVIRRRELPPAPHQVERLDLVPHELVGPVQLSLVLGVGLEIPRHRASLLAANVCRTGGGRLLQNNSHDG